MRILGPRRGGHPPTQALGLAWACTVLLQGCNGLPELPRLPSLPRLPNAATVREAVAPTSSGATLSEAIQTSRALADAWSTASPTLVEAEGKSIDLGGRNGGFRGGSWAVTWRVPDSNKGIRIDIRPDGQATNPITVPPGLVDLGGRSMDGLLDSPVALQAGGLGTGRTTVLLSRVNGRARYNLVAEGEPRFVLIDAITGEKLGL